MWIPGVALLGVLAIGTACSPALELPPERIVLVVVDTLRRDHISAYGDRVSTPRIDELAEQGQVLERPLSSFHSTTMSMASLFTGRTPSLERGEGRGRLEWTGRSWCGMVRFAPKGEPEECIPSTLPTLAERLQAAGYWTAGIVTNKLLYRPGGYERGFQYWEERPGFAPTAIEANAAAREALDSRPHDRLFLYVHYMDVHDYGYRGEEYVDGVEKADWAVGDLLEALEARGLRDGTLVIVTSDHGERLGEEYFVQGHPGHNGNPSFDVLLEVPLIVSPPVFDEVEAPVRSDDLYRRILQVAGAGPGPPPELEPGELFVSEVRYQTHRQGRWKIFRHRESGEVHLVDLESEAGERRDVSDRHPEVVAERMGRVDELVSELGAGDVPPLELTDEDRERLEALGYVVPGRLGR